jgi:dTDP-glucose 4,6-dehydratase
MKFLVTGGAGFLGGHLCETLLAQGAEVVAVDNFATGSASLIERLADYRRFSFIEGDVCAAPPVGNGFDAIAHLACPASPDDYLRLPLETLSIGSHGSEFVLQLAGTASARNLLGECKPYRATQRLR